MYHIYSLYLGVSQVFQVTVVLYYLPQIISCCKPQHSCKAGLCFVWGNNKVQTFTWSATTPLQRAKTVLSFWKNRQNVSEERLTKHKPCFTTDSFFFLTHSYHRIIYAHTWLPLSSNAVIQSGETSCGVRPNAAFFLQTLCLTLFKILLSLLCKEFVMKCRTGGHMYRFGVLFKTRKIISNLSHKKETRRIKEFSNNHERARGRETDREGETEGKMARQSSNQTAKY